MGNNTLSERASSAPVGFFSLPDNIRNSIYRRVLVMAHPLYISQHTGSQVVESFVPERPYRWRALLYTNRQVYHEASAVLYGSHHFEFLDTTQHQGDLLQSFFNCIGSVNAGLLSHLSINFPVAESVAGRPGKARLREDDLYTLKLLQEKCTNISTLETFIYGRDTERLTNTSHEDAQFIRDALLQIDAQLKAISSLNKIIVKFYNGTPSAAVMELMRGFGWVILRGK